MILAVLGVSSLGVAALGCGQDVASCGAVCPAGADPSCTGTCNSLQATCSVAMAGADFQALLTCVANTDTALVPLPALCEADYNIVAKNCGVASLPDAGAGIDSGTPSTDAAVPKG